MPDLFLEAVSIQFFYYCLYDVRVAIFTSKEHYQVHTIKNAYLINNIAIGEVSTLQGTNLRNMKSLVCAFTPFLPQDCIKLETWLAPALKG
jgi:hypothetical protein